MTLIWHIMQLFNWQSSNCWCVCVQRKRAESQLQTDHSSGEEITGQRLFPSMHQWSRMRRFPETILFSSMAPAGISIRSPWLAMMMTVPWINKTFGPAWVKSWWKIKPPLKVQLACFVTGIKSARFHLERDILPEGDVARHGQVV